MLYINKVQMNYFISLAFKNHLGCIYTQNPNTFIISNKKLCLIYGL